jgi:hypothetical protein
MRDVAFESEISVTFKSIIFEANEQVNEQELFGEVEQARII